MNPAAYRTYLRTPHWREIRLRILRRAKGWCEQPGCRRRATEVHHKVYYRCPWREWDDDLIAVCGHHHQALEAMRRQEASAMRRGRLVAADFCGMAHRLDWEVGQQMNLPLRR